MQAASKNYNNAHLRIRVFWGDILYDTAIFAREERVTVGRKLDNTFIMDLDRSFPSVKWELVKVNKNHSADLQFPDGLEGHIRLGAEVFNLRSIIDSKKAQPNQDGLYSIHLSSSDTANVAMGHVSFYVDWVPQTERITRTAPEERKRSALFILGSSALITLMILVYGWMPEPPPPEKPPERIVTLIPKNVPAPKPKPKIEPPAKAAIGEKKTAEGGAAKGDLGKAKLEAPKPPPKPENELKNVNLGNLVKGLSSLSSKGPTIGNTAKPLGGIRSAISQTGTGGFSTEGLKTGGGGQTVGIGRTVGQGQGGFEGTGRLGLSGRSNIEGGTGRGSDTIISDGGLDRDVIDNIVRRRQDRVRLCYERQLNFHPGLAGKITIQFTIGKNGEVLRNTISEDTMRNKAVADCLQEEVKGWTFPKPRGGTLVSVDYPFVFESGG